MSYRCDVCCRSTNAGQKAIVLTLYYSDGQVKSQQKICGSCDAAMKEGVSFGELVCQQLHCDVCGEPINLNDGDAQVTSESIVCHKHLPKKSSL